MRNFSVSQEISFGIRSNFYAECQISLGSIYTMNFGWAEPVLITKSSSGFIFSSSNETNRLKPRRAQPGSLVLSVPHGCGTVLAQRCFTR